LAGLTIGHLALIIVAVLIILGAGHRVLDRLYLSDKAALAVLAAMFAGSFLSIPITTGRLEASINVGGGLIPIILALYVLFKAGTAREWGRALIAAAATAGIVYLVNTYFFSSDPWQTGMDYLDPLYVYPLVAGLAAYLLGRSRRGAFIAAVLSVVILDIVDWVTLAASGIRGTVAIGGAGAFDIVVLSGFVAVLLAELIGETRERLQGGPESGGRPPRLVRALKQPVAKPADQPADPKEGSAEDER